MKKIACIGWWEQGLFGRQPMNDLVVEFEDGRLRGQGYDIVGLFTIDGLLLPGGSPDSDHSATTAPKTI